MGAMHVRAILFVLHHRWTSIVSVYDDGSFDKDVAAGCCHKKAIDQGCNKVPVKRMR